jgi:hypothetical protein
MSGSALEVTTGRELVVAMAWLESVLEPDATLNALHPSGNLPATADAPAVGAAFPVLVYSHQAAVGPGYAYGNGARALFYVGLYQVKAITQESGLDKADPIAARAHVLLHGAQNVAVAVGSIVGEVLWCLRRDPLSFRDVAEDGRVFRHHGGLYEIATKSS